MTMICEMDIMFSYLKSIMNNFYTIRTKETL